MRGVEAARGATRFPGEAADEEYKRQTEQEKNQARCRDPEKADDLHKHIILWRRSESGKLQSAFSLPGERVVDIRRFARAG